jgi:hypothetical protein
VASFATSSARRLPPASTLMPKDRKMYQTAGSGVFNIPRKNSASSQVMASLRQSTTATQSKNAHHSLLTSVKASRMKSTARLIWLACMVSPRAGWSCRY